MRRVGALLAMLAAAGTPAPRFAPVVPGTAFSFPRDHGAHPAFRTEWWYVTGWLDLPDGSHRGFQITFFRTATGVGAAEPSRFAPRQILFAHAALSDPAIGHLLHAERIARQGFGLAETSLADTDVRIDDWHLVRSAAGQFVAHVGGNDFALDIGFRPTQPVLLEGEHGYSRKSPDPNQASDYYSMPHLTVSGTIAEKGVTVPVRGTAWLDREWSSSYLAQGAAGWDWTGLNFDDGGALMAFRIRRQDGVTLWAGGSRRDSRGRVAVLGPGDVAFDPRHRWRSPHTGAIYPVDPLLRLRLPGRMLTLPVTPLMPDQELDGRAGGSPIYWEGAVSVPGGRGYLELTGYAGKLAL